MSTIDQNGLEGPPLEQVGAAERANAAIGPVTELTMSRQQRYQARHRAAGLCLACSRPVLEGAVHCRRHHLQRRRQMRRREGLRPWQPGGRGRPPIERLS
jgi:hypothetical protein